MILYCCKKIFIFAPANTVDVAQLVRATDCGSVGRGFEPHPPPHSTNSEYNIDLL